MLWHGMSEKSHKLAALSCLVLPCLRTNSGTVRHKELLAELIDILTSKGGRFGAS